MTASQFWDKEYPSAVTDGQVRLCGQFIVCQARSLNVWTWADNL
jgi:hypothetical protein